MPLRDRNTRSDSKRRSPPSTGPSVTRLASLAAVFVSLLIGGGWLYWKSQAVAVSTSPETLCPTDRPPSEVVAILLDVSDQLAEPQLLKIEHEIQRVRDSLPTWGLIETYVVARGGERLPSPFISLCNPGDGSEMSRIYQNPDIARKRWEGFAGEFGRRLRAVMDLPDAEISPILESIQAVALRTFDRPELDGVGKRLVVVSDLMQHVPGSMSHYQGVPAFKTFESSDYYAQVRVDLSGVDVTLLYLDRSAAPTQGAAHISFWQQYFAAQGADLQDVTRIFGDQ